MKSNDTTKECLFSYGTLQMEQVQRDTFGRSLEGQPDTLPGYIVVMIRILDEAFVALSGVAEHKTLQWTGQSADVVDGTVLALTRKELEMADAYEPTGYGRVCAELKSGTRAWVYLYTGD